MTIKLKVEYKIFNHLMQVIGIKLRLKELCYELNQWKTAKMKTKFREDMQIQSKIINNCCKFFCNALWKICCIVHCNLHIGLPCRSNTSILSHLCNWCFHLHPLHCLWKSTEMFRNWVCSWLLYCKLTIGWRAST